MEASFFEFDVLVVDFGAQFYLLGLIGIHPCRHCLQLGFQQ